MSPRKQISDSNSEVSESSSQPESSVMYDEVKHHERRPGRAIILVANGHNFNEIAGKCKKILEARKKDKTSFRLKITLPSSLQAAINDIMHDKTRQYLMIIVSQTVEEIMFHVTEPHISTLRIQRCSQEKNANPQLTLSGMSTYIGTRVDEWQNMQKPKEGALWIGENVVIRPDIIQSSWARPAVQSFSRTMMDGREQMLHRHFNDMDQTPIHAPSFWQQWSGYIAGILGLAAGSAKLLGGFDAAAKGIYLQYQFGLFSKATFAAGSASLKVMSSAVLGPATLLGVGVAATVYFMPWDSVYSWLTDAFSWLWKKIKALWQKFKDFMASTFSRNVPQVPEFARSKRF